ncbi:hypothetical protein DESC_190032 [Desulfosarcina cetonica]|nr:hypothetical protein DESC_190032 [Desulfosarcina cetonica]
MCRGRVYEPSDTRRYDLQIIAADRKAIGRGR